MDTFILALQEAGIVKVISPEENVNAHFDTYLPGSVELSDPTDRSQHAAKVLQSWRDRVPKLRHPGISLCQACEKINIDAVRGNEGYIHSQNYWALLASAEQCPMCLLMVNALRGQHQFGDFDKTVALLDPLRTDYQVCLCTNSAERESRRLGVPPEEMRAMEVSINNTHPFLPPGILTVFALPSRYLHLTIRDMR
jgi:hypothetical protein